MCERKGPPEHVCECDLLCNCSPFTIYMTCRMHMSCFISTEDDLQKSWKDKLLARRVELLMASCLILVVTLALSIGLGGEELSVV